MAARKTKFTFFEKFSMIVQSITIGSICALGLILSHPKENVIVAPSTLTPKMLMTVTAYTPTDNMVATMRKEKPGLHAAVSPDRIDLLGKRVYIKCGEQSLGIREIVDLTDSKITNTIDLMVPSKKLAREFGECSECKVMVIN